jgi:hypothetical protein
MFRCGKTLIAMALLLAIPVAAAAQTADTPAAQGSQAPPPGQPPPTVQPLPIVELLKPEQLEALVAPIALYPDELLANVLAASTYPLEVVQADRWLKERKTLKGDALKIEVEKQSWDDSIKALASTPEDERQARLDQGAGRRRACATAGADGCGPAVAQQGF